MQYILLAWEASSDSGWGVGGLNIFMHWAASSAVQPMMLFPINDADLRMVDPLRRRRIDPAIAFSNPNAEKLLAIIASSKAGLDVPVVHACGNDFGTVHKGRVVGKKNVARLFIETSDLSPHIRNLDPFDAFVCGSQWNADILRAHTQKPVHIIHEAIDPSLFFPGEKSGLMDSSRFYIFTGGKIEPRKAQDLVLLAFREFSRRHDDAVLVALWHSPWPQISLGFKGRLDTPLALAANGMLDIAKWVAENGIDPAKVIDLGAIPNQMMPAVLREMDCALQPSRAEGGTNVVVTEAMGCGLPVILGRNSGMLDVIDGDNCVPLLRQTPVAVPGRDGWGESDVEEIIEALEKLYTSRELRKTIGTNAAAFMKKRPWSQHAEKLKDVVLGL